MAERFELTAKNYTTLQAQIDKADAALVTSGYEPAHINIGKAVSGHRLWYVHGKFGGDLKDGLSFDDLVSEAQKRLDTAFEGTRET